MNEFARYYGRVVLSASSGRIWWVASISPPRAARQGEVAVTNRLATRAPKMSPKSISLAAYQVGHVRVRRLVELYGWPSGQDREHALVDVSVLTPSYGYGRFIEDCILSVLKQEGVEHIEHVVQDGASSDETVQVLRKFERRVNWVSEPDVGQSDALNRALERAGGRWIGWLNADEFYLPGALAWLVNHGERSGADVVYGETVFVDERGRLRRLGAQHRFNLRILREYGCYIASSSLLIRRDVLSQLGDSPWDRSATRQMDWDLYLKLALRGATFLHIPRPVGAFREHEARVTAAPWHAFREEEDRLAVRYGMPADSEERWRYARVGRWGHPILKLVDGAYARQVCARSLRGSDLRWFRDEVGDSACQRLLGRCARV
jgi:glycosyltransferase involved in cell wall biosynthesis